MIKLRCRLSICRVLFTAEDTSTIEGGVSLANFYLRTAPGVVRLADIELAIRFWRVKNGCVCTRLLSAALCHLINGVPILVCIATSACSVLRCDSHNL